VHIGIDVDGVLTNIQNFNRRHAPKFFIKKFDRDVVDDCPYDIRDIFKCPENEYRAYWKRYLFKYAIFEPARKGAKETIRKLRTDGHLIFIITKRVFTCQDDFMGKLMRVLLKNWLWRNGIKHDEVVFCDNDVPDSKRSACLEKQIDVMVDDEVVNINAIMPIAKVICFDASYNRGCPNEDIIRVSNFEQVYEEMQKIAIE